MVMAFRESPILEFSSQEALLGFFRVFFWADSKGNPLTQIWPVGEFSEEFFFGVKTVTQAQILLGGTKLEVTDTVLRFFFSATPSPSLASPFAHLCAR